MKPTSKYLIFFFLMASLLIYLIMTNYGDQMVLIFIIAMMMIALLLASAEKSDIPLDPDARQLAFDFIVREQHAIPSRVPEGEIRLLTDAETKNIVYPIDKNRWQVDPYKHLVMLAINDGILDHYFAVGISIKGTLLGVQPLKVRTTAAEKEKELQEIKGAPKEIEKKIEKVEHE